MRGADLDVLDPLTPGVSGLCWGSGGVTLFRGRVRGVTLFGVRVERVFWAWLREERADLDGGWLKSCVLTGGMFRLGLG